VKYIDIENWNRKNHFHFFRQMDAPHFNICANVDISELKKFIEQNNLSFFKTVLYIAIRTANSLAEFRQRISGERVIEHEVVHARFTVQSSDDLFGFCAVSYSDEFNDFYARAVTEIEKAAKNPQIGNLPGRDDLIYMSCIPWISFTSYTNAMHLERLDSIPRIVWGKYFRENGKIKMPLSVQAHHALVDGKHIGEYFNYFENLCQNPDGILVTSDE
jgi:chloramphenicol O-acetyltransferase type A